MHKDKSDDYNKSKINFSALYRNTIAVALIWVLIITGTILWSIYNERNHTKELAENEARSLFNKDLALRLWATAHGGVYVTPDERTPPNPYLSHLPDRDIQTTSGKNLTLMNPAYMLRQAMEYYEELYGVKGYITSLKPLNPINTPDEWKHKVLIEFERGTEEFSELVEINGNKFLSLMRPMITNEGCLKCHAHQGYKVGDIRGGVGVSVPMEPYLATQQKHINNYLLANGAVLLIGLLSIGFISYRSKQRITDKTTGRYKSARKCRAISNSR